VSQCHVNNNGLFTSSLLGVKCLSYYPITFSGESGYCLSNSCHCIYFKIRY